MTRKLLQISLTTDQHAAIKRHCSQLDIPMAIWARELMRREIEEKRPERAAKG